METCEAHDAEHNRALIFDLYRGTTHDGPGLRSTVFLKGCPLSCAWCHNPEGISPQQSVWWESKSCIGCGLCYKACRYEAISTGANGIVVDHSSCVVCGACVKACPAKAMTFTGDRWELDTLLNELQKDQSYYNQTGGGVTASGGEALMQADFVARLFAKLHEKGISTALDTCGLCSWETLKKVLMHTDYLLYDLKLADNTVHKRYTGADNTVILENAKRIARGIEAGRWETQMWIRTPLIPNATATQENLAEIGAFIVTNLLPAVTRWELCAFNNSCAGKYQKLGRDWSYANEKLLDNAQVSALKTAAISSGCPENLIFVTGLVSALGGCP